MVLVTPAEIAHVTGYTPARIRMLCQEGRIPCARHGGRWRVYATASVAVIRTLPHGRRRSRHLSMTEQDARLDALLRRKRREERGE